MKVYVVTEDWRIDSGESDIFVSVFSTFEKALLYYEQLKKQYEIDYSISERQDDIRYSNETINEEFGSANIVVDFEDSADYYEIDISEKEVDEYCKYC